ncbi:dynamin family protein [Micromonospora sp. C72]|uniref:dynamin family protein n=1 Tax=Micromonospora sp. C72 TaxID=2824880 RepID=UPI001B363BEC|nr:dynamin family protein [Micromonospora sp. C72]MBQ1041512.1 dynamin family protein [Micromonospora sp. C72]
MTDPITLRFEAVRAVAAQAAQQLPGTQLSTLGLSEREAPTCTVVAFGSFDRGKSTMLAALVGDRALFPHEPAENTAVATSVYPGRQPRAFLRVADGSQVREQEIDVNNLSHYVSEQSRGAAAGGVVEIEIRSPQPLLAAGLVLVDTPGILSRNPAHNAIAHRRARGADVLLVAAAVDRPMTQDELDELARIGRRPRTLLVVTKVDKVSRTAAAAYARENAGRVAQATGQPADNIPIAQVTAEEALYSAADGGGGEEETGIPGLRRMLLAEAATLRAQKLDAVADRLDTDLANIAATAAQRLHGLQAQLDNAAEVTRRSDELRSRLHRLDQAIARAPQDLTQHCRAAADLVEADLTRQLQLLQDQIQAEQGLYSSRLDPDTYAANFTKRVLHLREKADTALTEAVLKVWAAWAAQSGLDLDLHPGAASEIAGDVRADMHWEVATELVDDRPVLSFAAIKAGAVNGRTLAISGGAIGGMVGGVVTFFAPGLGVLPGAAIGALLGHLVGWASGIRDTLREERRQWRKTGLNTLSDHAPAWVDDQIQQHQYWLGRSGPLIAEAVRDEFTRQANTARGELLAELNAAATATDSGGADMAALRRLAAEQQRHQEAALRLRGELRDARNGTAR